MQKRHRSRVRRKGGERNYEGKKEENEILREWERMRVTGRGERMWERENEREKENEKVREN